MILIDLKAANMFYIYFDENYMNYLLVSNQYLDTILKKLTIESAPTYYLNTYVSLRFQEFEYVRCIIYT